MKQVMRNTMKDTMKDTMENAVKSITIYETKEKRELNDLFGIFFEDLNHAADGGLYPEQVQNRSFEYCKVDNENYHALTAWEKSENLCWKVQTENPLAQENPHYLHVNAASGDFILNTGYNSGIFVEKGKKYNFSLWARFAKNEDAAIEKMKENEIADEKADKKTKIEITVIETTVKEEKQCAHAAILLDADNTWKKYEISMEAQETTWNGRLCIRFQNTCCYDFDMISFFPQDTFCGRKNGLRKDIAEALVEMKPKFMRFPGGCLTHTGSLNKNDRDSMYRWENTIGPLEKRPSRRNNWGYNQTFGIGYYEYFLFCEDIGAKPLPVLPGGFNPHTGEGAPHCKMQEWVQEALDLIEFANGSIDTKWGSIRAQLGHEAPFGLEYLAIGNEEVGDGFFERYPYFHEAIRSQHPEIKIINSAGPFSAGESYEAGWASAKKYGSDLIDEHYYCSPEWFLANMHHYEDYDEKGPKVFLGEYASEGNCYYNSLVEAAYMTHLERSKAVGLACYAPMLCNKDYVNWKPDMLWFDNHQIVKTPNYYVQKLFMNYQGTQEVAFSTEGLDEVIPLIERDKLDGAFSIQGNDVSGKIWDITVIDEETKMRGRLLDFTVDTDNKEHVLTQINRRKYSVEFSFKREQGKKGLKIHFGKKTDRNYLRWEFGGWANGDCNIVSVENGHTSVLSHRIFMVEDQEYRLKLEVERRHVRTWINGVLFNDVTYHLPELEELYVAASVDKASGQTILKVVNLTGENKQVQVRLDGKEKNQLRILSLRNHKLTDENTFDEPNKIVPTEECQQIEKNQIDYCFEAHSFTVMVFEKKIEI